MLLIAPIGRNSRRTASWVIVLTNRVVTTSTASTSLFTNRSRANEATARASSNRGVSP